MDMSTIVIALVLIAVALIVVKFFSKMVSFVFSLFGIVAVVWLVVLGLQYMDQTNIRQNFIDSNNLFVLEDAGDLVTGFATNGDMPDQELISYTEFTNPNSKLYADYYKVIVVKKEALPEKIAAVHDVAETDDRVALFKTYVENELLTEDVADNLVEEEETGNIEVYKETLAFRHGIKDILMP